MSQKVLWDIHVISNCCIMTPGRRSAEEFCARCLQHDDGYTVSTGDVCWCYARWIPYWEYGVYLGQYLDYPVEQKQGAFLITYAEIYGENTHE